MKKLLVLFLAMGLLAGFASVSMAQIANSRHNLSGFPGADGEICKPCHAPHNNQPVTDAPLWNHAVTEATFTTYSSPTFDAVDPGVPPNTTGQPTGVSKLCLSCHDGTVAIDSFGGRTGNIFIQPGNPAFIGTDLSNDHPISFTYDTNLATNLDTGLNDPATTPSGIDGSAGGSITQEMLFANKVECASCHDVHNEFNNAKLLLKPNDASALCLTCHIK